MEKGATAYCACGKQVFLSRKDAKAYKRQNPRCADMRVYKCDDYGLRDTAPFHLTTWTKEDAERYPHDD